jgi:hypothetical protein
MLVLLLLTAGLACVAMDIPTIPGTGTLGGEPCELPYSYNKQVFFACTYAESTVPWCATGESAAQWGQCEVDVPGSFPKV